ncbi:hypothetical protein BDD12DRAFT_909350 [Trichophaea hybrida]|nr:hypothetical protein BDD12DRAFT_909350 [Trichophaea hybrida]
MSKRPSDKHLEPEQPNKRPNRSSSPNFGVFRRNNTEVGTGSASGSYLASPAKEEITFNTSVETDTTTLDSLSVHSSDQVFIDGYDAQSGTQYIDKIEEQWLRNQGEFPGPGHGSESTSQVIDLCEVDTQDRQCIEDYTEKRVVPVVDLCSSSDDKDNKEQEKEPDLPTVEPVHCL